MESRVDPPHHRLGPNRNPTYVVLSGSTVTYKLRCGRCRAPPRHDRVHPLPRMRRGVRLCGIGVACVDACRLGVRDGEISDPRHERICDVWRDEQVTNSFEDLGDRKRGRPIAAEFV